MARTVRAMLLLLLLPPYFVDADLLSLSEVGAGRLGSSTVTAITQGPDGFLWIGTSGGLTRYDGYSFVTYRRGDGGLGDDGLGDDRITALHASGDALWVGTASAGLFRYDPRSRRFSGVLPDWSSGGISALASDDAGALWIGTDGDGLIRLAPGDGTVLRIVHDPVSPPTLSSGAITSIAFDLENCVAVGTADRGVNVVQPDGSGIVVYRPRIGAPGALPVERVTALLAGADGDLWIGTGDGAVGRFDTRTGRYYRVYGGPESVPATGPVTVLLRDAAGDLWVGRDRAGVVRLRDGVLVGRAAGSTTVRALYEDRSGTIWIGGFGIGLWKYVPHVELFARYLTDPRGPGAPSRHIVWSLAEDAAGRVWAGTDSSGLFVFDPPTRALLHAAEALGEYRIPAPAAFYDLHAAGGILLAALGEAGAAELGDGVAMAWTSDPVISVHADEVRRTFGILPDGLVVVDPAGHARRYPAGRITVMVSAGDGSLWLGSASGGLYRFRPGSGRTDRYDLAGVSSPIRAIDVQPDGTLWIAGGAAGAILYDPGRGERARVVPGTDLPSGLVYGVVADGGGGVWISTDAGLYRLDARTGVLRRFGVSHGLASDESSAGALLRASDGTVYVGSANGFSAFRPEQLDRAEYLPRVVLSSVAVPGRDLQWTDLVAYPDGSTPAMRLPPGAHGFTVTVASADFTSPESTRYRHRLIGYSAEWTDAGTDRVISYADLPPGDYRLYVRTTSSHGTPAPESTVLAVHVPRPPRSPWPGFAVSATVALLVSIALRSTRRGYRRRSVRPRTQR